MFSLNSHAKNCFLESDCTEDQYYEVNESLDMIMSWSKPEYLGSIYNFNEPIKIEYNLPKNFSVTRTTIVPVDPVYDIDSWVFEKNLGFDETGDVCLLKYPKKSYGCGEVEINDLIALKNNIEISVSNLKKNNKDVFELNLNLNTRDSLWNWLGLFCDLSLRWSENKDYSCTFQNIFGIEASRYSFKNIITKNGNKIDYDKQADYFTDWGSLFSSLTDLITPIFNNHNSNYFSQGDILFEYPIKKNLHYNIAKGIILHDYIYNLNAIIVGKTSHKGRESILIKLESNDVPPITGEPVGKKFTVYGYQIVDIKTGLIIQSRINMDAHVNIGEGNHIRLVSFLHQDINI